MRNAEYSRRRMLRRNILFTMAVWTAIVVVSLIAALNYQEKAFQQSLHSEAASMHAIDMGYRAWVIRSGGIYAEVSGEVRPSPWLAQVPDRDVTTPSGHKLTLLNSSYLTRLVHEGMAQHEDDLRGHIASLHPINPANAADAWERKALESFAQGSKVAESFDVMADGKTYYRYMKPMVVEESCMKCHGQYGSKLGDIRGGVSVAIPVAKQLAIEHDERNQAIGRHGLVWMLGLLGLFISGRYQARAISKIEKGEAELKLLTNSLAHAVYGQDRSGRCTFINDAGVRLLGYDSAEELLGKRMHDLVHHSRPDGTPHPYEECPTVQAVREGKPVYVAGETLWRKDGSPLVTDYWSYPVLKEGYLHGSVVTFIDIGEQLRIKSELKYSKMLLDAIVENIPAMVFLKRARDLRFELFNRAGEQMLGYSRDDLLGKNDYDFFPKEQAEFFTGKDREVLDSHEVIEMQEEPIKTAEGKQKWLHTLKVGLYDERGEPSHLLGLSLDITRRKQIEDELRESEARLAEAQHMAHLGYWQLDLDSDEVKCSDEAFRIFDIDPEQFDGRLDSLFERVHPDDLALVHQAHQDLLDKRDFELEHRLLMQDGSVKYVLEKCATVPGEDGKPLCAKGTVQDVTVTHYAERALREQHQMLEQALEGTIRTASIAVELRDPYTAGHQRRVADLACAIAQEMGLDEGRIRGLRLGAQIHDIGKIGVPAEILSKPSKLSPIELQMAQRHAEMGHDIIKEVKFPWPIIEIVHQHHERMDGSGYPQGLKGEQICLEARIVAVADVVEAMMSHRPYRTAQSQQEALDEITSNRGTHYDEQVVDACLRVMGAGFEFEFGK